MALPLPGWILLELRSGGEALAMPCRTTRAAGHIRTASASAAGPGSLRSAPSRRGATSPVSFGTGPHEGRDRCRNDLPPTGHSHAHQPPRTTARDSGWGPCRPRPKR
ncbi:hypothetical protein GCM10010245_33200 [Streptomyces spectabilis]|nr:hypothetical protein GCM10010245_33200 [Streptomyces spectabilis]